MSTTTIKIQKQLQERVKEYFAKQGKSKNANGAMITKTATLLSARAGSYLALMIFHSQLPIGWQFILFFIFSFAGIGIGFSVMHDANH